MSPRTLSASSLRRKIQSRTSERQWACPSPSMDSAILYKRRICIEHRIRTSFHLAAGRLKWPRRYSFQNITVPYRYILTIRPSRRAPTALIKWVHTMYWYQAFHPNLDNILWIHSYKTYVRYSEPSVILSIHNKHLISVVPWRTCNTDNTAVTCSIRGKTSLPWNFRSVFEGKFSHRPIISLMSGLGQQHTMDEHQVVWKSRNVGTWLIFKDSHLRC